MNIPAKIEALNRNIENHQDQIAKLRVQRNDLVTEIMPESYKELKADLYFQGLKQIFDCYYVPVGGCKYRLINIATHKHYSLYNGYKQQIEISNIPLSSLKRAADRFGF